MRKVADKWNGRFKLVRDLILISFFLINENSNVRKKLVGEEAAHLVVFDRAFPSAAVVDAIGC